MWARQTVRVEGFDPGHARKRAILTSSARRSWSSVIPAFTRNLPLNPRLFASVPQANRNTIQLVGDGTEVPITTFEAAAARSDDLWIEPVEPLLPGKVYQVVVGGIALAHLETAQASDDRPPTVSGIEFTRGGLADNCGPVSAAATVKVERYSDDMAVGGGSVLQLDVFIGDGSSERLFLEHPATFQPWASGIGIGGLYDTGADCVGHRRVPGAEPSRVYEASATIWDWSGNSSTVDGLSFALEPAQAPAGDEGCSAVGGTSSPLIPHGIWTVAVALGVCRLLRRRARSARSAESIDTVPSHARC
jgi:hypothetical protein